MVQIFWIYYVNFPIVAEPFLIYIDNSLIYSGISLLYGREFPVYGKIYFDVQQHIPNFLVYHDVMSPAS